jgi:hypothetical protein
MAFVWSSVCALAALAAGMQKAPAAEEAPQMRTKVLPGYGYIRYEVVPGDDEAPPGELIVIHEERRATAPAEVEPAEEPAIRPERRQARTCVAPRAKLIARLYEIQGMQIEPEFAEWLEQNLTLGTPETRSIQVLWGEPLLLSALKSDGTARGLAEDLARCERAQSR